MFDAVAFAMGKAGMSCDVVSALMGGNGGGGSGTLEESGWVKSLGGGATVSGNRLTIPSGDVFHNASIAPPGASFAVGDEVVIAFTVIDNYQRLNINAGGKSTVNMTDTTGYVKREQYGDYCLATGSDVVTYSYIKAQNNIEFKPVFNNGGGTANAYATIDITGMKFNGELIFGKV